MHIEMQEDGTVCISYQDEDNGVQGGNSKISGSAMKKRNVWIEGNL